MTGPHVPRKDTSLRRSREELAIAAYMIGVTLCNERNRLGLTQAELADEVGITQTDISHVENGSVPERIRSPKIDRLFTRLGLDQAGGHASFLKWWRDNSETL
ncbi:MAG: helix-turn-helix domain-containing protein [Actinobacteria bacterium]|nr:helix-turn-helix domain-containing protein [Actinomycetota bacterium]